jgi:hypothetical protein
VPGTRASGLDIADFNFPVRGVLASSVITQQSCLNEAGRPLYLKSFDDRTECGEESELSSDIIFGGGLNAFAIAVALSATTFTWIPIEIVRAPLRSPNIRILRRRKSSSAESHLFDQSDSESLIILPHRRKQAAGRLFRFRVSVRLITAGFD